MTRVFVSYSRTDRSFATRLAVDLTRAGLNVWYDRWEILPGDSIVEKIESALQAHDCLLVILSPEALTSQWLRRELNSSLMRHLAGKQVKVIPIMAITCELPVLISDLRYADFTDSYESGFAELLASFGQTPKVPAYTSRPRAITELDLVSADGPVKTLFPVTFEDWPDCVLGDGPEIDALVIVGSTNREKVGEGDQFERSNAEVEVFGTRWRLSRQASPGTVRDVVRVVDLAAHLTQAKLSHAGARLVMDGRCVPSTSVCPGTSSTAISFLWGPRTPTFSSVLRPSRTGRDSDTRSRRDTRVTTNCILLVIRSCRI